MNSLNPWEFPPPVFFSIYSSYKTSCYVNYSSRFSSFHCSIELLLVKFMWVTHSSRRSIIYTRQDSYNEPLLWELIQALHCLERGFFLFQLSRPIHNRETWTTYKRSLRRVTALTLHWPLRGEFVPTFWKLYHLKTDQQKWQSPMNT